MVKLITPITDETWSGLSPKQKWDIRVAMRGPDCQSKLLKHFTTAILRHACREAFRVGGDIVSECPALIVPDVPFRLTIGIGGSGFRFQASHFLGHVTEAAEILGLPKVCIPNDLWLQVFSENSNVRTSAVLLYGFLTQPYMVSPPYTKPRLTRELHTAVATYIGDHFLVIAEDGEDVESDE